jgi:hypothetical protein
MAIAHQAALFTQISHGLPALRINNVYCYYKLASQLSVRNGTNGS